MFKLITQSHLQKCAPTLLFALILSGCGGCSDADSETQVSEEQEKAAVAFVESLKKDRREREEK